ncbi:hypothetical protein [Shewanella frigidimarina]|uniref:hypothetical protein n=1 Tax=Shewanella frigidimarina TaxID=56812 RepID=UPI003D7A627F
MQLPFNELSLDELERSEGIVLFYRQLEELVKILDLKSLPNIIFKSNFASININGLGTIYEIVKSSSLSCEQESALFSIIQNTPYIDDGECIFYEIHYNSKETYGFLYSHYHKKIAISIPHNNWSDFDITVNRQSLCCETEKILSDDTTIRHIGDLNLLKGTWFESLIPIASYNNVKEFVEYYTATYLKVILSTSSIDFLKNLNIGKLRRLQRSLDILEMYCNEKWKFGGLKHSVINDIGLVIRPESSSTMQQYGEQRIFKNETGENEIFSIHFDISDSERAYIKGISHNKSIFVAYIGPHLSTKKFPK